MGFTLYDEQTGRRVHYEMDKGKGDVVFGRRDLEAMFSQTDLTAPDFEYVSRRHFILSFLSSGIYRLVDVSRNGTCVNGCKTRAAEIKHGDLIRVGPEDMNFATALYFLEDDKKSVDPVISVSDTPTEEFKYRASDESD